MTEAIARRRLAGASDGGTLGGDEAAAPDDPGTSAACANDACRASFENADWRLRLEVLDDDLLHFEFARADSTVAGERIEATEMIARREDLEGILDEVLGRHGTVEGYLREACGVGEEKLSGLGGLLRE